jgi:deoxyribonuclease V
MILAVDVCYRNGAASIAGIYFSHWRDAQAWDTFHSALNSVAQYTPGEFYLRELPCIMRLLDEHHLSADVIVIDGYVYLGEMAHPGLGRHLYNKLDGKTPVIGVAKKPYKNTTPETEVYRGNSKHPLYVTSVGIDLETAKSNVRSMHGKHRIPTLLKYVDRECRGALTGRRGTYLGRSP